MRPNNHADAAAAFWARVHKTESCWLWLGSRDARGYGKFDPGRQVGPSLGAHRYAYQSVRGPIPAGLTVDHLCRNPNCVRPDHLEVVTLRENLLRGRGACAVNASKTHCKNGHEYTGRNKAGERYCRLCRNAYMVARRHRADPSIRYRGPYKAVA